MKRIFFVLALLFGCASLSHAQSSVVTGLGIMPSGATIPTTCNPVNAADPDSLVLFYHTTSSGGAIGLYQCTATNTWSAVGAGGSGTVSGQAANALPLNTNGTSTAINSSIAAPTTPNGVPQLLQCNPSAGSCTPSYAQIGTTCVSDTTTARTYIASDRGNGCVVRSNASNMSDILPDAGSTGFGNGASLTVYNKGAGTLTINRQTSSTFCQQTTCSLTSITVNAGNVAYIYTDPDATDWVAVPVGLFNGQMPSSAGAAPTTNGVINYDSTANAFVGGVNSATNCFWNSATNLEGAGNANSVMFSAGTTGCGLINSIGGAFGAATDIRVAGAGEFYFENNSSGDIFRLTNSTVPGNFLGTNDIYLQIAPAGASAYSVVEDTGSVALALGTSGARPVDIAPNKTITSTFPSGGGQTYTGSAPAITLTGTTPYLNMSGPLIQEKQCSFSLTTAQLTTAASPVNLCTITLPNAAVVWRVNCQGGWSVTAGTTPTFAVGNNWAQAPTAVAGDANIGTSNAGVAVEGFTSATTNSNIVATGTLTTSATIFPVTWWTTFTGSATSGAYHPTASVTGTSATGTLVGFCTIQ